MTTPYVNSEEYKQLITEILTQIQLDSVDCNIPLSTIMSDLQIAIHQGMDEDERVPMVNFRPIRVPSNHLIIR